MKSDSKHSNTPFDLVTIAISTGGPKALIAMLPHLCQQLTCPILIVQHMPVGFTATLAINLNKACSNYTVCEAKDGEEILPATVYIAPGGYHMKMAQNGSKRVIKLTTEPMENGCRPAADVLFRSIANSLTTERLLAIILTGMGSDGTRGVVPLRTHSTTVIAQDKESSIVWGMPGSAVNAGLVDIVAPLMEIPDIVSKLQK